MLNIRNNRKYSHSIHVCHCLREQYNTHFDYMFIIRFLKIIHITTFSSLIVNAVKPNVVFGGSRVQNSAPATSYPDLCLRGFPQFIYENTRIVPYIMPQTLPSTSFPIHNSLILSFSVYNLRFWKDVVSQ
jgi:hypothetical protein